jgi:hypothetical protein
MLKNVCRDDLDVMDLINHAVRNPHGGDRSKVYNVQLEAPRKEIRAIVPCADCATIAPICMRPFWGELRPHRAMIEAGFRTLAELLAAGFLTFLATVPQRVCSKMIFAENRRF